MLSTLASLLLLGIIPPPSAPSLPRKPLPGIEVMHVTAPTPIVAPLTMPKLSASGMLLVDLESGQELLERNADVRRPMASLTKIMTALIILENHGLTEVVTVPAIAEQIRGSTLGLKPGDHLTVEALLKGLLIPSANDAAYTLAAFHGHGLATFVAQMNDRAKALGLTNTHFANPAGLDNDQQFSSPRDLAWLTKAALRHDAFRSIVGTRSAHIYSGEGKDFALRNTNEMLHYNEDVFGVKTGTTDAAGECLIILFTEHSRLYLLVLLGSKDRYTDGLRILQAVHDVSQ